MQGWLLAVSGGFFALGWIFAMVRQHLLLKAAARTPERMAAALDKIRAGKRLEAANFLLESEYSPGGSASLHLVAASLLREQGEYGRAIQIHKRLRAAAAAADADARAQATYELGLDYFLAGFFNLAEECFRQLADSRYAGDALEKLLFIHLRTRSWSEAVAAYRQMEETRPDLDAPRSILAHLYCEWACEFDEASSERVEKLDAALKVCADSVRALLLRGDCALIAGDARGACEYWRRTRCQPGLLFLLPERILAAHERMGEKKEGLVQVGQLAAEHPSPALLAQTCKAGARPLRQRCPHPPGRQGAGRRRHRCGARVAGRACRKRQRQQGYVHAAARGPARRRPALPVLPVQLPVLASQLAVSPVPGLGQRQAA